MISAFIITKDESHHVKSCIDALRWADEVVVVDSGSSDGTVDIARSAGARVIESEWRGYSGQRNFAIEQCQGEWLLYMDADERPGPGFAEEARRIEALGASAKSGYSVNTLEYFMGDFLQHGGFGLHQANRKVRLWRAAPAHRFHGTVHERVKIHGELGQMRAYVQHYSTSSNIRGFLEKLNSYTDLEAQEIKGAVSTDLVLQPARTFVTRYLRHQGFRDGVRGLVVAQLFAMYRLTVIAKALERELASSAEEQRSST